MIDLQTVSKDYRGLVALESVTLTVAGGEIVGLLGPNGAGKSTLLRIATGLTRPSSGRVSIATYDITNFPEKAKAKLGYVPETPAVYESLTATSFLDLVGALYDIEPSVAQSRSRELLELLELETDANRPLGEFSKGMRQKVVIAAALVHQPEALVLDEAFDGLDPHAVRMMTALLSRMSAAGTAILFASHQVSLVERLCTRVAILNKGRVVAEGTIPAICNMYRVASLDLAFGAATGLDDPLEVAEHVFTAIHRS